MEEVWEGVRDVLADNVEFNEIEHKFKFNVCEHFVPGEDENALVHTNIHDDF